MERIDSHIANGAIIKWVGYHGPRTVWVHLVLSGITIKEIVELDKDYTDDSFRRINSSAADEAGVNTGTIWSSDTRLDLLRLASVLGISIGSKRVIGPGQEFGGFVGCKMAYDIESDRSRLTNTSFGTLSESIISIATYCSCGEWRLFSFIPDVKFDYTLCESSRDTVTKFIEYVESHSPQWLLGYNNFAYDNTRIFYHSEQKHDPIEIMMRVGSGSSLTYAGYLDIPGVYNIDLYPFLDKTRRSKYENMKLATIVKAEGAGTKIDFDTTRVDDFPKFFEYNVHDSKITLDLAIKSGVLMDIANLCTASCIPPIDANRFVSGTFGPCAIASYCLSKDICMDWSPCTDIQEYRGAEVLKPIIGTHENVVSCDFSSMYPSVLLGANISIENFTVTRTTRSEGSTWVSSSGTNFVIDGKRVAFNSRRDVIIPPVMKLFVDKRNAVRKTNPALANALKVSANSIYGSLGDRNSKIYNPFAAKCITGGGRWCLSFAETFLKVYGYRVVYGDTDSCFVASTKNSKGSIESILEIMSRIFDYTPFPGMKMDIDNRYTKISFLGKKTYFGRKTDGSIISKGMSKSRKDRVGVCRSLASNVVPILMSPSHDMKLTQEIVGDMICAMFDMCVSTRLTLADVSKIVKKGGTSYYEFVSQTGTRETIECESVTGMETVNYSPSKIMELITREMKTLLTITGTGSVSYVMRQSSII
jgi:DNA polymerase elongation subunit (family B)